MIRGFLEAAVGVLLFFSLFAFGISWDLSSSLSYQNVENNAVNAALSLMGSQAGLTQQVDNSMPLIKQYCQQSQKDISLNYKGYNITISCSDENATASKLINDTMKNVIKSVYYAKYNCGYWDCFSSASASTNGIPLFLVSEKSYEYWKRIFDYSIASSILLIGLFVLLSKKRESSSLPVGILLALSALPLLAIQKVISGLPNMVSGITSLFFSQTNYVFVRMIIAGGILTAAGIAVRIAVGGSRLYDHFHKKGDGKNQESNPEEKPANQKGNKNEPKNNRRK